MSTAIILASTSTYRRALLEQLQLPFSCANPHVNEQLLSAETASQACLRLAKLKAQSIIKNHPHSLVIGSDQLASFEGNILGKPGNHLRAFAQLKSMSGKTIIFHTGLCVMYGDTCHSLVEDFQVHMRHLTDAEINNYLHREQPYDCAGSFKSEGLGISLFTKLQGSDPNTLIGLPLIALTTILNKLGCGPLQSTHKQIQ
ncbi:MAG: septum formation inhibitor Maf [Gammaproteobacteria bacterium]|nr:septum formation inhibitor Maf [Gammaproteobacteria bacterium]